MRAIFFCLLASLPSALAAGEIRLAGSDLLGLEFAGTLQNYARRNELSLTLALDGSRDGLARLRSGRAEIALLVLLPGEAPPAAPWHSVPLAYHTVVVLVPAALPIQQLTFGQLGGIFGASSAASSARWGELGLTGEWASLGITPQVTSPSTGLALELFRHEVLRGGALKSSVIQHTTDTALVAKMSADRTGIALASALPPDASNLKTLSIARADHDVAFAPTPQNLRTGDYPLRLALWLVVRRDVAHPQLDLLRFLLSDDVALTLEHARLVPLSREARNQFSFDLEQL